MMAPDHRQFARDRVIVMAAPNGARRRRADCPGLPVTPAQLADCAVSLAQHSVAVMHLHVRDEQGRHTLDPDHYRAATTAIRSRIGDGLVLQITSEAVGRYTADEQMDMVKTLRPEAVSLALTELCPDETREVGAARFFAWLVREKIWPQFILYTPADLVRFDNLRTRGVFSCEHPFCLFVLGRYASGEEGDATQLEAFMTAVDCGAFPWAVCCFGGQEQKVMIQATDAGGHVRIGFENNILLADGTPAPDNAALVAQYVDYLSDRGRRPATADEIREQFLIRST